MVSLLIPAFNEEESIVDTIENAKLLFKNLKIRKFEIIVINDGSIEDESTSFLEILREHGSSIKYIKIPLAYYDNDHGDGRLY